MSPVLSPRKPARLARASLLAALVAAPRPAEAAPQEGTPAGEPLRVEAEDAFVRTSCRVEIAAPFLVDRAGDGVMHIDADGVTVDLAGQHLRGAGPGVPPDAYDGVGIVVTGDDVTLRNARVSGFRVGILARGVTRLVVEDCDVSDNFRQRLGSTPLREDPADWLRPHDNDAGEWQARYGAGIVLAGGQRLTVRRCRARDLQNGLILDRVEESLVYDNDFSFLSGWGVALWRSSRNMITRNALDFCVRGYSHGVYNRGQDSAGILMFEQCSENVIAENSATHGGDGVFAFAGREALGEGADGERDEASLERHRRRGNNDNLFVGNDLSYAAAHGLELTFSFGNRVFGNRLVGNGICGIWGGYSRNTVIARNLFADNGGAGYGLERGGVNIEHGQGNLVLENEFLRDACGVHLWWDEDAALAALPWARANGHGSGDNLVAHNAFREIPLAIHLRDAGPTTLAGNTHEGVAEELRAEGSSPISRIRDLGLGLEDPDYPVFGASRPVGAREHLAGREHILVDAWGPCDWERPRLWRTPSAPDQHRFRIVGVPDPGEPRVTSPDGELVLARAGDEVLLRAREPGVLRYALEVPRGDGLAPLRAEGVLVDTAWSVRFFAWSADPREDVRAFRREAEAAPAHRLRAISLAFGARGPSDLPALVDEVPPLAAAGLPRDRFGTLATTSLRMPAGRWRLRTTSDDGVRLLVDGAPVIEDWTHHASRQHEHVLELAEARTVDLRLEHFELDGAAMLALEVLAAP